MGVVLLSCITANAITQGKGNVLLFPRAEGLAKSLGSSTECRERLGGLLKYYYRRAA